MSAVPPPDVAAAAATVQRWLDQQQASVKSAEELAKLSAAEKLDYARRFDQSKMPEWRDPRGANK